VDLLVKQHGELNPTVASAMVDAAVALRDGGMYDSARVVLERALPRSIQGELIRLYEVWGPSRDGAPGRAAANGS